MWHIVFASGNLFSLFKTKQSKMTFQPIFDGEKQTQVVKLSLPFSKLSSSFPFRNFQPS